MLTRGDSDFRLGAFDTSSPEKLPPGAVLAADNFFTDDSGGLKLRGGVNAQSETLAGLGPLDVLWEGFLAAGRRTLLGSAGKMATLAADAVTPVLWDGAVPNGPVGPAQIDVIGGVAVLPGGHITGGARKAAYTTGTVSLTNGSDTVTGTGTSWSANVEPGMLFIGGAMTILESGIPLAIVKEVVSNTSLKLMEAYRGPTAAGQSYTLYSHARFGVEGYGVLDTTLVGVVGEKLLIVRASEPDRVYVSAGRDASTGALRSFVFTMDPTVSPAPRDYHAFPGAEILGISQLRGLGVIFTTAGIYTISGLAGEAVDARGNGQRRVELYSQDVIPVAKTGKGMPGAVPYRGGLIVPATDDVYLIDLLGAAQPIAVSARRAWRLALSLGWTPGRAQVYRGHYLLPLVNAAGVPQETWAFRIDRPVDTPIGVAFPWTKFKGQGGKVAAFQTRHLQGQMDELWAGGASGVLGMVLEASGLLLGVTGEDEDGTLVEGTLTGRDYTGAGLRTLWRRLRIRYRLEAGGTVAARLYVGGDEGTTQTVLAGSAPPATRAVQPFAWDFQRQAEMIRAELVVSGAAFVLEALEMEAREPGRAR